MTSTTLGQLISHHGIDVLEHLDRDLEVPVLNGLQMQGDLAIIPTTAIPADAEALASDTWTEVPAAGIPVIPAVGSGHEHRLLPGTPATALWQAAAGGQDIGLLAVPAGAPAYLAHPEHGYVGIGTGTYVLRRQREQADEERLVAD